ncbi:DUF551 domain-containing protein [Cronobacter sakazakii]
MKTISNERLESLQRQFKEEGFNDISDSEIMQLVEENLALRKEREKAVTVAYPAPQDASPGWKIDPEFINKVQESIGYDEECECCEGTPSMEMVEAVLLAASKLKAPPAPVADDSLPFDPQIAEYEQMMEAEQAQADTTSQQFESLAGKAVSGSEGFECTPVADLYELLTKCGECYDYTTSAKVAADWIKEGYSAREYVKLDRLQEAMTQGSPGEADGWIPCSERMPPENTGVLVATEFDGPGDWRMKWGTRVPGHPDSKNGWFIPGASWTPSHWQPLPEPPCK